MGKNMSIKVVIKYGGHAMTMPELQKAFGQNLLELSRNGMEFVITHGGGPQIASLLDRLHIESHFEKGLRVTDEATLEVVEMILCGQVNKEVVRHLAQYGVKAAGISGEDGGTILARQKDPSLGHVGEIVKINPDLINTLLNGGYLPVVAPLGLDAHGNPLNINADTAAGAIAGALDAKYFILVSDVPGVLDTDGNLFPSLDKTTIAHLCASEIISGGMLPKVHACQHALECGCGEAIILDGRQQGSLKRYLMDGAPLGTTIKL